MAQNPPTSAPAASRLCPRVAGVDTPRAGAHLNAMQKTWLVGFAAFSSSLACGTVPDPVEPPGPDCVQLAAPGAWQLLADTDVSIELSTAVTPPFEDTLPELRLLFERYGGATYQGTVELGVGANDNFGTCAHCAYVPIAPDRALFATQGVMTLSRSPFSRRLEARVSGLRLEEVEVSLDSRESFPIPGGRCITAADIEVAQVFPAPGWTCAPERFNDELGCDCECGAFEDDCTGAIVCLPGETDCRPRDALPATCAPAQECVTLPLEGSTLCADRCDRAVALGCTTGACVYDFGSGAEVCVADPNRIDAAGLGETCASGILQRFCAVDAAGISQGFCDAGAANTCVALCTTDTECAAPAVCVPRFGDNLGACGEDPFGTTAGDARR